MQRIEGQKQLVPLGPGSGQSAQRFPDAVGGGGAAKRGSAQSQQAPWDLGICVGNGPFGLRWEVGPHFPLYGKPRVPTVILEYVSPSVLSP